MSPFDEALYDNLRAIRRRGDSLHDNRFSKMGGSSVVSSAFLHCFSSEHVELNGFSPLQPTIDFFRGEGRHSIDSFRRNSEAAGVGWSLHYPLAGRPARFRREIQAFKPRFAFVMFGGNDVGTENERVFAQRLMRLVRKLSEEGVVPILGTTSPRRSAKKDVWVKRYNQIIVAVSLQYNLPLIDYASAMRTLPDLGLARDGVHPNVLGKGGLGYACRFDGKALQHGQNVRNLLTLMMLDRLRRWAEGEPAPDSERRNGVHGLEITLESWRTGSVWPGIVDFFPYSALIHEGPAAPTHPGVKPGVRFPLLLKQKTKIRASAFTTGQSRPLVSVAKREGALYVDGPHHALRRRKVKLDVELEAGNYDLMVVMPTPKTTRKQKAPTKPALLLHPFANPESDPFETEPLASSPLQTQTGDDLLVLITDGP